LLDVLMVSLLACAVILPREKFSGYNTMLALTKDYRFSGEMVLMAEANTAWTLESIGRCLIVLLAGSFPT